MQLASAHLEKVRDVIVIQYLDKVPDIIVKGLMRPGKNRNSRRQLSGISIFGRGIDMFQVLCISRPGLGSDI